MTEFIGLESSDPRNESANSVGAGVTDMRRLVAIRMNPAATTGKTTSGCELRRRLSIASVARTLVRESSKKAPSKTLMSTVFTSTRISFDKI